MTDWANNSIEVLNFLVPGFIAAAVYYGLTSAGKPNTFERLIQALIFTIIINAISTAAVLYEPLKNLKWLESAPVGNILIAVILGFGLAVLFNKDLPHRWFRRWGITKQMAYPTHWYSVFANHPDSFVVVHLRDGRRVYGWPRQWPGQRQEDRLFVIDEPQWLADKEDGQPVDAGEALAIQADDVEMVEFLARLPAKSTEEPGHAQRRNQSATTSTDELARSSREVE